MPNVEGITKPEWRMTEATSVQNKLFGFRHVDFFPHLTRVELKKGDIRYSFARTWALGLIGDLSASRVQAFLADLREKGTSIQTSNHYLRAIKQFTRWIVKDRRAGDDPLAYISMLNVSTDRRHDRRPFSEAELTAILTAANVGPVVRRMKGPDRAML